MWYFDAIHIFVPMAQIEVYYTDPASINPDNRSAVISGDEAHHLLRVRRGRTGEELKIIDGLGTAWDAKIVEINDGEAFLELFEKYDNCREPPCKIKLGLGILKIDHFLDAVDLAVQLGVSEITPLKTEYVNQRLNDSRLAKIRKRVLAATKQCGRGLVPPLLEPQLLEHWSIEQKESEKKLIFVQGGTGDISQINPGENISVAIGCEGGFSGNEKDFMVQNGFTPISLGPRRLRSETAVASALSQIGSLLE